MNKKGQVSQGLGIVILIAITLIVGVIFFQVIAQEVGSSTSTVELANHSLDVVVNGTAQYLTDYRALGSVVILNATNSTGGSDGTTPTIASGNYTVTNNVIHPTTGDLCVRILPDGNPNSNYTSAWQVSGTAQPLTYIADSGGRAVASLIVIFFALAVAVIALEPTLRSGVLGALGK
jgi:uncharacterized protein (UPF0333 family)